MNARAPITGPEVLSSAAAHQPAVLDAFDPKHLIEPPVFCREFFSPLAESLCGPITLRYPTFSDLLEIERQTAAMGGGAVAEWMATLRCVLESAPVGWYRIEKGSRLPVFNTEFPDGDALQALFLEFLNWRRLVRGGGAGTPAGGTGPSDAVVMAGFDSPEAEPPRL